MKYIGASIFTDIIQWLFGIDRGILRTGPEADWELGWQNLPSTWLLVLIIIPAVIGGCYLLYRWEPGMSRGTRYLLAGLRMAAVGLILMLLFQPYLYNQIELQKENHIAVLVDTSGSMSFKDRYKRDDVRQRLNQLIEAGEGDETVSSLNNLSRLDILKKVFENNEIDLIDRLAKDQVLDLYRFSTDVQSQSPENEINISKEEGGTAIGDAINTVYRKQRGQKTSGIVIFTDGQSNVGSDPISVVRNHRKEGNDLPVYTVAVGAREEPGDLVLEGVEAPDAAQANMKDPVVFTATVRLDGKDQSRQTQLVLETSDGKLLEKKQITVGDKQEQKKIHWNPEQPGTYQIQVRLNPLEGEIRTENNQREHRIRVVDRKMSVFYFERLPRYEYRFLKNSLIRDDSLEVKALLYSADEQYPQPTSPGLNPATHFPRTREELAEYDVIVIGDVRPSMFRSLGVDEEEVLSRLKTFVEELGGGVLFLSGTRYNPSSYSNTPLEELLPVVTGSSRNRPDGATSFNPDLTPAGVSHPIMRLVEDRKQNIELWEDNRDEVYSLEPIRWYHPVMKEKLGAKTLARVPEQVTGDESVPLITVNRYGRGRTMYVGTDDTWVWRKVIGNKYFYTFWSNSLRWLRGGRLSRSKRYKLRVEKDTYRPGERVKVYAHALDRDYRPRESDTIPLHVLHRGSNQRKTVNLNREESPGEYTTTFLPKKIGSYQLWVGNYPISSEGAEEEGEREYAETGFQVRPLDLEGENPSVNEDLLQKVSSISGGQFKFLDEIMEEGEDMKSLPDLVHQKPERISQTSRKEDLWDAPIFLILFLGFLSVEWIIRKRTRLI